MNRIELTVKQSHEDGKKILSPYITAGDPTLALSVPLMHALVLGGADILEIGIPFSDPMAEGPVIQRAMERALLNGVNLSHILEVVQEFRKKDSQTPIVLMGYLNSIEQLGYEKFAKKAEEAGVDGTILVDLPPEEAELIAALWEKHNLLSIYLCSPTTSKERMVLINQYAKGYLYYVSLKGVTGSDAIDISSLRTLYDNRKSQTTLPLMVGFGIKTPNMAKQISQFADGVIVGAALIESVHQAYIDGSDPLMTATNFIKNLRNAMDNE